MNKVYIYILFLLLSSAPAIRAQIIDSDMNFEEALEGIEISPGLKDDLCLVDVYYYSFDNHMHKGQLLINKALANDIMEIFEIICDERFPVGKVIPIVKYKWSDELSMLQNNSSSFNYRRISGSKKLSSHSTGKAIDINPMQNPGIKRGKVSPPVAVYNKDAQGTILAGSRIVKEFKKRGWQWGGNWRSSKDYQHFEKK